MSLKSCPTPYTWNTAFFFSQLFILKWVQPIPELINT